MIGLVTLGVAAVAAAAVDSMSLFQRKKATIFGRLMSPSLSGWTARHRNDLDGLAGAWKHSSSFLIDVRTKSEQRILEKNLNELGLTVKRRRDAWVEIDRVDAVPFEVLAAVTQYIEGKTVKFKPLDQPISNLWSRCLAGSV